MNRVAFEAGKLDWAMDKPYPSFRDGLIKLFPGSTDSYAMGREHASAISRLYKDRLIGEVTWGSIFSHTSSLYGNSNAQPE